MPQKHTTKTDGKKKATTKPAGKQTNTVKVDGPAKKNVFGHSDGPAVGDPQALAELSKIESQAAPLASGSARNHFRLGLVLLPVRKKQWFLAKGFVSFEQYCEEVIGIPRRTAQEITDAAASFSEDLYVKLGESHAELALRLMKATPEEDTVADVVASTLRYGSGKGKKFTDATVREIREDIAGEHGEVAKPPRESTPPAPAPVPTDEPSTDGASVPSKYRQMAKVLESTIPNSHVVVYAVKSKSGTGSEIRFDIRGLLADKFLGSTEALNNLFKMEGLKGKGDRR